jgi:predicted transcriptional regulator
MALNILLELEGESSLDQIVLRSGLTHAEAQNALAALVRQGLVEAMVEPAEPVVPAEIFSRIQSSIAKALGPVGEFLLDEKIEDLGHSIEEFPIHLLPELVEDVAQEIRRPEVSLSFKRQMIGLIRTLNRL